MPIDSNIFFQGAALNQQNAARTQDTMRSFFDTLAADKLNKQKMALMERELAIKENKTTEFDVDPIAKQAIYKMQSGIAPNEQEMAAIRTYALIHQGAPGYNPNTGRMEAAPSPLSALGVSPLPMPQRSAQQQNTFDMITARPQMEMAPAANVPYMQTSARDVSTQGIPPVSIEEIQGVNGSPGIQLPGPAPASQQLFNTMTKRPDEVYTAPGPQKPILSKQDAEAHQSEIRMAEDEEKRRREKEAKKEEPMNATQGESALYADRMAEADRIIGGLEGVQKDIKEQVKSDIPVVGNYMISSDTQKAKQAQRNFINANLRRESGATIQPHEFEEAKLQYFPQPGDQPAVLAQKAENRKTAIEGIKRAAGPAYKEKQPSATGSNINNAIEAELNRRGLNNGR